MINHSRGWLSDLTIFYQYFDWVYLQFYNWCRRHIKHYMQLLSNKTALYAVPFQCSRYRYPVITMFPDYLQCCFWADRAALDLTGHRSIFRSLSTPVAVISANRHGKVAVLLEISFSPSHQRRGVTRLGVTSEAYFADMQGAPHIYHSQRGLSLMVQLVVLVLSWGNTTLHAAATLIGGEQRTNPTHANARFEAAKSYGFIIRRRLELLPLCQTLCTERTSKLGNRSRVRVEPVYLATEDLPTSMVPSAS
ncbi:hypothetical protein F5Y12DRAFT_259544 [Xylaria sp. FL1777]|nr:hypothetical protein F5Y12DRAFT_259544 [Xylaria sp. FL1777]